MLRYFAMVLFSFIVVITAQESEKESLNKLLKSNEELREQLQAQNKLIQKLQMQFSQLEKKIELLTKKNKPISAKEKKELLTKIAVHQKATVELESQLNTLNQNLTLLFIRHSVLTSFCKDLKDSKIQMQINLFLEKNSIIYTYKEEKNQDELFISKCNYKFSLKDINLIGQIVKDLEQKCVPISRISIKGKNRQIAVDISFLKVNFTYIEKILQETMPLISNIKLTKDIENAIKKAEFSFSVPLLKKVINIFDATRKLPISVTTQLRIIPLKKSNQIKKTKTKAKVKPKKKSQINFTSIEKGQEQLKTILSKKSALQKKLKSITQVIKKLETTGKIYEQIKSYQVNIAKKMNDFIVVAQQKTIVLNSLDIRYIKQDRQRKNINYEWTNSFFYFATSLEPIVAFIDQITFLDFDYKKPLHFKNSALVGRKGYRFFLHLFPKIYDKVEK